MFPRTRAVAAQIQPEHYWEFERLCAPALGPCRKIGQGSENTSHGNAKEAFAQGGAKRERTNADEQAEQGKDTPAASTLKRAELYKTIYRSWRRGINCTTLAERHNMKPRRVQQLIDEMRAASVEAMNLTNPLAGLKLTDELLVQLAEAVTEAAEVTEKAIEDRNWNAAIAGLKRAAQGRRELLELWQARGVVPRPLGVLQGMWEGVTLVAKIVETFERHGISDEIADEVAASIEMQTRRRDGHLELVAGEKAVADAEGEA